VMISVGAVANTPDAVTAWKGLRDYFNGQGEEMEFVLFSSYGRQIESLLRGHIDFAWNSPLAHLSVQRRTDGSSISLCMRDSDRDLRSRIIARRDAKISSLSDLSWKTLAVGSEDSVETRILPLFFLRRAGVDLRTVEFLSFDDSAENLSEAETCESGLFAALEKGRAQAGVIGDLIWRRELAAGRVNRDFFKEVWTSPPFDNCVFDAIPPLWPENPGEYKSALKRFCRLLYAMSWGDRGHRQIEASRA
jgi:phosphonate transport system substrate-binding protein